MNRAPLKAFTLIELLVVITIIGLLASVILASLASSKESSYVAKRTSLAKEIQNALELYYTANKQYPSTCTSGSSCTCLHQGANFCPQANWESACTGADVVTANWIPGLVPSSISVLPDDPEQNTANGTCCFMYKSNGADYKLLFAFACNQVLSGGGANPGGHMTTAQYGSYPAFFDPKRDGTSDALQNWDGTYALQNWALYSKNVINGDGNPASW
jgi:prepilin-type N-terminal cleavage/methylation domain-containing protein